MKKLIISGVVVFSLSGCTSLLSRPVSDADEVAALSDIIQCEIIDAFEALPRAQKAKFKDWGATYLITQNVKNTATAGLNPLRWVTPARVDKFLLSGNADAARETFRNGKVEFSVPVFSSKPTICKKPRTSAIEVNLKDFKLRDWTRQVSAAEALPNSFNYSVTVQVTTGVGVAPSFANGRGVADGSLAYKHVTVMTIDFGFSRPPKDPKPLRVVVVSDERISKPTSDGLVPRRKSLGGKLNQTKETPAETQNVPESVIIQNRQSIQGLQLDRISPFGLYDR